MQSFHIAKSYLTYWLNAVDEHSLHSPFVYNLYTQYFKANKYYAIFETIENLRQELLKDSTILEIVDLGGGSRVSRNKKRSIRSIATHSLSRQKFSQLLFKLIGHFRPKTVLELGTSLGVNTLYMASYSKSQQVYTFEGCPSLAQAAKKVFLKSGIGNITLIEGNLNETLSETIESLNTIDFVYLDANHTYEATINYFNICMTKAHDKSVFVVDDIYWSPEMTEAWRVLREDPRVTTTIDIFDAGFLFLNSELKKQHFTLEF